MLTQNYNLAVHFKKINYLYGHIYSNIRITNLLVIGRVTICLYLFYQFSSDLYDQVSFFYPCGQFYRLRKGFSKLPKGMVQVGSDFVFQLPTPCSVSFKCSWLLSKDRDQLASRCAHLTFFYFCKYLLALLLFWNPNFCDPIDYRPSSLLCSWNSPGKNTGGGSHSLLQRIFPTQGSNVGLSHCRQILYHLSHQGRSFGVLRIY